MDTQTQTRRCPLWVKIVLALSLALNLAIAGLVAGFVLRGGPSGVRGPAAGYAIPYVLALPRDARREVFSAVRRDPGVPDRGARRAAYRDMIAALQASPFDRAVVQAVLDRQAEGASRAQTAAQVAWLAAVERMSDDERRAYTQQMQEAMERRAGRDKKDSR